MIVFGWKTVLLRQFRVKGIDCPICKTKESVVFSLLCRVYHFFFIPFFPDIRYIYGVCEHCGERIEKIDLETTERDIFNIKQYPEKAPRYSWIGCHISILIIFYLILK